MTLKSDRGRQGLLYTSPTWLVDYLICESSLRPPRINKDRLTHDEASPHSARLDHGSSSSHSAPNKEKALATPDALGHAEKLDEFHSIS